jgi:hypothetical protein
MIDRLKGVFGSMFGRRGMDSKLTEVLEKKRVALNARSAEKEIYDDLVAKLRAKREQYEAAGVPDRPFVEREIARLMALLKKQASLIALTDKALAQLEEIEHSIRVEGTLGSGKVTVDAVAIEEIEVEVRIAVDEAKDRSNAIAGMSSATEGATLDVAASLGAESLAQADAFLSGLSEGKVGSSEINAPESTPPLIAELDAILGASAPRPAKPDSASGDGT